MQKNQYGLGATPIVKDQRLKKTGGNRYGQKSQTGAELSLREKTVQNLPELREEEIQSVKWEVNQKMTGNTWLMSPEINFGQRIIGRDDGQQKGAQKNMKNSNLCKSCATLAKKASEIVLLYTM